MKQKGRPEWGRPFAKPRFRFLLPPAAEMYPTERTQSGGEQHAGGRLRNSRCRDLHTHRIAGGEVVADLKLNGVAGGKGRQETKILHRIVC